MKNGSENSLGIHLKCSICYNYFGGKNLPLVLKCGHTFCTKCISKIFDSEERTLKCAFDKKVFHYDLLDDVPLNFSFLQIIKAISSLKINDYCKFDEQMTEFEDKSGIIRESKPTVEEFSNCKTILDLNFIQSSLHIEEANTILREKKIPSFNNCSLIQKFLESKKFMIIKKNLYENGEYYEGIYQNGKKNGWGRKRNLNNVCYEGFFENGNKHGWGIEINKYGDIYIGEFENNLKSGEGNLFYSQKNSKYKGKFYMNKKEGEGEEYFQDGSTYKGGFSNGKRTGQGVLTYMNRNFLKGEFVNGLLNGEGKEKADNFRYKGNFRDGVKHDYGIIVYDNGSMYKGLFLNNKPHGKGNFKYSNGNIYEGDFYEGKKHGIGKLEIKYPKDKTSTLLTYNGEFLNDFFEGEGTLMTKNKSNYTGDFLRGLKSGYGVLQYSNGDEFRGYFEKDMKNGDGQIFYFKTGEIITGKWRNNKLEEKNNDNNRFGEDYNELDDISIYQ